VSFLIDHMWQTLQVIGCLAFFAWLTRRNSAKFRLWLWRIAALKLLVPLHWLEVVGAWLGFPVPHSAEPPPAGLVRMLDDLAPWFAPGRLLGTGARWFALAALSMVLALALRWVLDRLRAEAPRVVDECRRLDVDPDDHPPGVGFLNAVLMSAWVLVLVGAPLLSGAIDDRLRRQELIRQNERALHAATVIVRPAAPGMGSRLRVVADERGVTIRNATLQEIGGLAYGVSVYLVRGQHFVKEGEEDWLTGPRHDVRVMGAVVEPEDFDTYALREPLTKALATQYGLEIYQNGKCQPPCGRWGSFVLPAAAREASAPDPDSPASVRVTPADEIQLPASRDAPVE
jgi:hypothetical protein